MKTVFNTISVRSQLSERFFHCEAIGEILHNIFQDERLFDDVSVWEPMSKKTKLPTFNIHVISCNVNTREDVVNIKKKTQKTDASL